MQKQEIMVLKNILKSSQEELHELSSKFLRRFYGDENVIETKSYICAKGDIPIALVAHLDTVFQKPPQAIYYDEENQVMWSPNGLGADDRAGVYSIYKIVRDGLRPHVILTTDEEYGGIGARNLSFTECPFKELLYLIELDRQGCVDCVFYDCSGDQDFIDYIESFGFYFDVGTYTDICELSAGWGISGVNLSIGYVREHSQLETLYLDAMNLTIKKVKAMLMNPPDKPFKNESYLSLKCKKCQKVFNLYDMQSLTDKSGNSFWYCQDCCVELDAEWCKCCYSGYMPGILKGDICPTCLCGFNKNGGVIKFDFSRRNSKNSKSIR